MDLECYYKILKQNKICHLSFVFALCSLSKWLKALYSKKRWKCQKIKPEMIKKNYESKKELNLQRKRNSKG